MKASIFSLILVGEEWSTSISSRIFPRKEVPVTIELEESWASMTVMTFFRQGGSLTRAVIKATIFHCPPRNPVAVKTLPVFPNQGSAEYLEGFCEEFWKNSIQNNH
jgi:hypothetical protein